MHFWKDLRAKIALRNQKKSVRVQESNLIQRGRSEISQIHEELSEEYEDESQEETKERSDENLAHIRRGYTTDLEDPRNVKILHSVVRMHWTDMVSNIIALHNHYIWRFALLAPTFAYFIIKLYQMSFLKTHKHSVTVIVASISDLCFVLNFICLVTIFFWKRLHLLFEKRGKFRLIFDAIISLPFHTIFIFILSATNQDHTLHYTLYVVTFCRMYYLEDFFRQKTNDAGVKHWNYFVARYILRLFLLTHTLACCLYLIACSYECKHPAGWTYSAKDTEDTLVWYLCSFFMAFTSLSNSGFNVFIATDLAERLIITITMCSGFVLTTLILIGALSLDLVNKSFRLANMRIQLYAIRKHLKTIHMSRKDTDLILNYYRLFWKKKKGVKDASAVNILPMSLQMEISFDINYYLLQCSILFRNKPEPFLRTLSLNMKHEFFQPGEDIYVCNDIKNKMICVASGIVEVTSDEDYESPIISFGRGSVLGEAALILSLPSKTTVRAANYCELQVLYKVDFIRIIHLYPEIFLQLREIVSSRIENFKLDEDRIQQSSQFLTLNLYVSQKKNLSAIKRLKKRLLKERFDDVIPRNHHACGLYKYAENVKKKKGRYIFLTENFPWILSPRSGFMKIWQITIFIDVIVLGFTYPYFIAYHRQFTEDFRVIANFIEVFYYIDIYVILTTAIESKDYVSKKFSEILAIQLQSLRFYLELLSTIPFELIFNRVTTQIYFTIKLNRLLKCFRICTFFDRIEKKVLTHNILGIRMIKYFTFIMMVNYWFGILLYSSTCFKPTCTEDGWFRVHVDTERKIKSWKPCSVYPTLMASYFGLTVLSTLGFNDIVPSNNVDLMMVILGTVLGIFLFGYCTSELSATISYYIQMKINFQSAMFGVEKFLVDNKMDATIIERVMKFFELQWYHNKGVSLWKKKLLHNAPTKLQDLVSFKETRADISNAPLFRYASEEFLNYLANGAEVIVLPPGEIVTSAGKYSRYIYIIQGGYCNEEKEPGYSVTLGPGDFFGAMNAMRGGAVLSIVSTITHVKLLMLGDKLMTSAQALFPEEKAMFQKCLPPVDEIAIRNLLVAWKQHQIFIEHSTPIKKEKKIKCREWLTKAIRESFIWVPDYCERNDEDYDRPFRDLGYFHRVRFILLPICILPQGWFLKIWVTIRYSAVFLIAILVPYQQVKVPYVTSLDHFMVLFDFVAYADLYLMLFVGYYGVKNQLIIHPCKTAKHYLTGSFILDVMFCFPWEYIVIWVQRSQHLETINILHESDWLRYRIRLIKILQVYRLPGVSTYVEKNIKTSGLHTQILKFLPFTVICLNACAAGVVLVTCQYYHITDLEATFITRTTAQPPGMGGKRFGEYTMFCNKDCWIERSRYQEYASPSTIYMLAFYFSTGNLVGLGLGDLTAQQFDTLIMVILMMICGTFFFGYVFAYTASYTSDIQSKFSIYQGMLAEMERYFQMESVSKKNQDLCLNNANYRWSRSGGIEANKILSIVHPALHGEAAAQLYQNTLERIPLFEGVDRNFFRIIGMSVRERYYTRGTNIFREDDVIDSIYIVHRGEVEIKFYHNFHEEMVTSVGVGGIMGNIGNTVKSRMVSTAVAMVNTDILHMKTDDFQRILKNHPIIKAQVDSILAVQKHTDFCIPLTIIEEKYDSFLELPSETSDEDAESAIDITSSENLATQKLETSSYSGLRDDDYPAIEENELRVLLLLFSPNKWFKVAVLPESKVLYAIVVLCVVGGYFGTILVTYQFTFQDFHAWIITVMMYTDIIYIWNIFFELHTAYLNRYSDYITDSKKIKLRYFSRRRRRFIDFLANTPFAYLAFLLPLFLNVDGYLIFSWLKLFSLFRILFIREFFNSNIRNLMVDRLLLNVLSTLIWLTMAIHFFSCLWYLFACPIFFCYEDSWVKFFYQNVRSQFELYLICIYFITGIVTNTGLGDVLPDRYEEILLLIILMLTVKFLVGIFIGVSANIVSLHSSFLTRYEAGIYELRDYLMNENVSEHQMEKMWNYVKKLWAKRRGRQMPILITDHLSYTNQCIVKFDVYGERLKKSYLFHDLQESFLRQLSNRINPVVFFPGNYIVQHGDSDQSMYLIHRGEVDVLTVHANLTETIHDILRSGEMFGVAQGLFYGIPHHFSYRAKTTVDIGIIRLKEWDHLLMYFPGAKEFIYKRAYAIYSIL